MYRRISASLMASEYSDMGGLSSNRSRRISHGRPRNLNAVAAGTEHEITIASERE
jgi:hypothetical protein